MTSTQPNNTDKITLAVLGSKLDALAKMVEQSVVEIRRASESMDARVRSLETCQSGVTTEISNIKEDMKTCEGKLDRLQTRDTWWNGINSIIGAIATALGLNR